MVHDNKYLLLILTIIIIFAGCNSLRDAFRYPRIVVGVGDYILVEYDSDTLLSICISSNEEMARINKAALYIDNEYMKKQAFLGYNNTAYTFVNGKLLSINLADGEIRVINEMSNMRFISSNISDKGDVIIRNSDANYLYSISSGTVKKISDTAANGGFVSENVIVLWTEIRIEIYKLATCQKIHEILSEHEMRNTVISNDIIVYTTYEGLFVYRMSDMAFIGMLENIRFNMMDRIYIRNENNIIMRRAYEYWLLKLPSISNKYIKIDEEESEDMLKHIKKNNLNMTVYYYNDMIIEIISTRDQIGKCIVKAVRISECE